MKVLMRAEEAGMCEQAPPDGDEGVPDAGRRRSAEDLHEQRPDASGDRGDRRERGNPPARLFSACSRELMRISAWPAACRDP